MRLITGVIWMISPDIRHNFLLSSRALFMLSIQSVSAQAKFIAALQMMQSQTIHHIVATYRSLKDSTTIIRFIEKARKMRKYRLGHQGRPICGQGCPWKQIRGKCWPTHHHSTEIKRDNPLEMSMLIFVESKYWAQKELV